MTQTSQDQILRFVMEHSNVRGEIITLSSTYSEATAHQALRPEHKTLLGEFLAAAGLLAETLKFSGTLTVQARGDGPVPLIMAEASNTHTLRGIVKTRQAPEIAPTTLLQAIGEGVLTLTVDPVQGQRYQGIVPLENTSLAECLTAYFAHSEQLPTRLWLFADQDRAAGLLLQALPPTAEHPAAPDAWQTAEALASTISADELLNLDHNQMLGRLFHEMDVRLFESQPVGFACSCSAERSLNALSAIGREDAYALLAERKVIEVDCEFCGAHYRFGSADLAALFGENGKLH